MKKLLACLLVPLTALVLGACKPASTSPESKPTELNLHQPKLTSNVWKISKEGQPDSYLLGTVPELIPEDIKARYGRDPAFRSSVDRYVRDFERLLSDVSRNDRDGVMSQTYLTSDTGKVYTMLAHASGRLR